MTMLRNIAQRLRAWTRRQLGITDMAVDMANMFQAVANLIEGEQLQAKKFVEHDQKLDGHLRRLDAHAKDLSLVHGKIDKLAEPLKKVQDSGRRFDQFVAAVRALTAAQDEGRKKLNDVEDGLTQLEQALDNAFPGKLRPHVEPSLRYTPVKRRPRY